MSVLQVLSVLCLVAVAVHSIAIDAVCSTNLECEGTNPNSFCYQEYSSGDTCKIAKACKCKTGYTGVTCQTGPKYIGGDCTGDGDCAAVANAVCTNNLCACPTGQTRVSKYNCILASTAKKIGDTCAGGDVCYYEDEGVLKTDGACTATKCTCPANTKIFGSTCKPVKIGDTCTANECPVKSTCTASICECEATYEATTDKTGCVLTTGSVAADVVCVVADHNCNHNDKLTCEECPTPDVATTKCALKTGLIGDACEIDSECGGKVSLCTAAKCVCAEGYEAFGSFKCLSSGKYKSVCWTNEDCTVPGNVCTGNVCGPVCDDDKIANGDGTACDCKPDLPILVGTECVTGKMNSKCTENDHCKNLVNSECKDEKCTCAVGYKVAGELCEAESGVGAKAAWLPVILMSALLSILSLRFL